MAGGDAFIGREVDVKSGKAGDEALLYDLDDLVTHGVIVGMTGSGKTGLGVDILEEAALSGIPAIILDPKGDLVNLLLHFPDLLPADFEPWINPDEAARAKKTVEDLAVDVAKRWQEGLQEWGIGGERIEELIRAVDYTVFTPGSDSGIPVNIMASLEAPDFPWEDHKERLLDRVTSTATAILGLVGVEADPIQSREHILLSNILETAWRDEKDLDLVELVQQIQAPPFDRLGAFELEQFYPSDDRMQLATQVNNLLAAPAFQSWTEGERLDIHSLLGEGNPRPRHSVFYLAHLTETERMFFITMLLTALESYLHTQPGSSSLQGMLFFDEVFGYIPPVEEPPSKAPLMRMIKQARAYGFGLVLTTQNPVDLDYKALSNAGTWFVGKLQAERDKQRLLDGLESVRSGDGAVPRSKLDKIISGLKKRAFILHNVHSEAPVVFRTRWAMAYLAGPITQNRVTDLNKLVGVVERADQPRKKDRRKDREVGDVGERTSTRPRPPKGIEEFILPNNRTAAEAIRGSGMKRRSVEVGMLAYTPALLAQAQVRFRNRKHNVDQTETFAYLVEQPDPRGFIRWDDYVSAPVDKNLLVSESEPDSGFSPLGAPLNDGKVLRGLKKDLVDHIYHTTELRLQSNPTLDLVATPGMGEDSFSQLCAEAADRKREADVQKLRKQYETKIKRVQTRLAKEERELDEDMAEHSGRKLEEMATHAENVLGLFSGSRSRRRVSSSMTKRRMTSKAKSDVEESLEVIEDFKEELFELESELEDELLAIDERWDSAAEERADLVISATKTNIYIELFGIAWKPFWQIQEGEQVHEIAAVEL